MIISVASGKGGTGKTTVSASLVSVWEAPVVAVDLDVEEPNLHLFLKPEIRQRERVTLEIPVMDESKCTFCREVRGVLPVQGHYHHGHYSHGI